MSGTVRASRTPYIFLENRMPEYKREDFEMDRWVGKMLEVKAITDKTTQQNLEDLRYVMKAFHELQLDLYRHGIPVRNIEKYKEVHPM